MIQAVFFDVDGVLVDSFEANFQFNRRLMETTGHRPPTREEFPAIFHMTSLQAIRAMAKDADEKEIKRIWKIFLDHENQGVHYAVKLMKTPRGVEKALGVLREKYQLGIITSRIRNGIYSIPALAKLKKYFSLAVAYEDTERHKPYPDPLLFAAKKLNIRPEDCVYVGDTIYDVRAAQAAKMKAIAFSRENLPGADARTDNFRKIPEIISKLKK